MQRLRPHVHPEQAVHPSTRLRTNGASKGFLFWLGFLAICVPVFADTLYFTSGDSTKGLVVEEHRDRVVLSTEQGERTLLRRDIDEIFYAEPERNHLYLGHQALEQGETALARGFYQKALQTNPDFQEARDALERLADVERKKEEPPVPDPLETLWRRWGITLADGTAAVTVAHLREGSPAARAGIELSDGLAACWSQSLLYLSAPEAAQTLLGPSGTPVKLTVRRTILLEPASAGLWNWPQVKLEMQRLGLTVAALESTGAAWRAGLRTGDRILQINNQSTRYLPLGAARRMIQKARKEGFLLVIERDLMIHRE